MNHKRILDLTILLMIFILPSGALASGTYWVSNNGTATWSNCLSATPLSGTACCSVSTAMTNASGNDLVYFRTGTYEGGATGDYVKPTYYPAHSGNSWDDPLIFRAYTGETVTFNRSTVYPIIGIYSNGVNYVTFDGFKIVNTNTGNADGSHMCLNGGNGTYQIGIRVLNCEFTSQEDINNTDLADQLFIRGISGFLIQNCYFRNHRATGGDIANTGAITTYSIKNSTSPAIDAVIEKCTFRDLSAGINYKLNSSGGVACTGLKVRYNLFYNNDRFDICINYNSSNGEFYQNLFINGRIHGENGGSTTPNHKIYNNTFIGGASAENLSGINFHNMSSHLITNWEWYNNICYSTTASPTFIFTEKAGADPTYADYNLYYSSGTKYWSLAWTSHTIAQWQAHGYDVNCVTTQPTFTNYTGDETGNYRLAVGSSGINVGRYGYNMGCYITGDEQIGARNGLTDPSYPKHLRITP
jgi:hypothetical protein